MRSLIESSNMDEPPGIDRAFVSGGFHTFNRFHWEVSTVKNLANYRANLLWQQVFTGLKNA